VDEVEEDNDYSSAALVAGPPAANTGTAKIAHTAAAAG
jgi:hypothetical protein